MNMVARTSRTLVMLTSSTKYNNLGSLGNAESKAGQLWLIHSLIPNIYVAWLYCLFFEGWLCHVHCTIHIDRNMWSTFWWPLTKRKLCSTFYWRDIFRCADHVWDDFIILIWWSFSSLIRGRTIEWRSFAAENCMEAQSTSVAPQLLHILMFRRAQ